MNLLSDLCSDLADTISCHPSFWTAPGVPVYSLWRADHLQKLAASAGTFQACAVVTIKSCGAEEGRYGVLNPVDIRVYLAENLALNRACPRADALALDVAGLLTLAQFDMAETPLEFAGISPVPVSEFPAALPEGSAVFCLAVDFTLAMRVPASPAVTAAPVITEDVGLLTISAVDGASVRYTTDGSAPTTASPLYIAPMPAPAGGRLSARAWHAGEVASTAAEWGN